MRAANATSVLWEAFQETPGNATRTILSAAGPLDQLNITDNDSDYLWYSFSAPGAVHAGSKVKFHAGGGSVVYVYLNGVQVGVARAPAEDQTSQLTVTLPAATSTSTATGTATDTSSGQQQVAGVTAEPGAMIHLLSVAMGVSNGGVSPR